MMTDALPTVLEAPPRAPLVEVIELSRAFGDVVALDRVSLTIAENEFFALLGPSGCGKTTLLRSIAGFEQPDHGRILLGGDDLLTRPPNRRPVNLMFQSYALFPHMTVAKNVAYGLERERLPKREVTERVQGVLEIVGLTALAKRRPNQLSGGQRQRVALARAIVKRPRLLLLDEPLSALDRKVRAEMQLELKRLQHEVGITFVVVTHDQEEAMSLADRIAVMANGRVQQVAPPVELYQRPANLFVADFVGTSNIVTGHVVDQMFVSKPLGPLPVAVPPGTAAGAAHLVVRPENVRIILPGDSSAGVVDGVVADAQFHGGVWTLAVDVGGFDRPFLVTVPGLAPASRGDRVRLGWDSAALVQDELV
ncbi:MAG: Putrescine transport ATP-binding protein PotG [uncultured Nocardioidaceae bacterium]|uniref:Spermidine/putrescine import ATP-binding protein PotA n=1 Tax=uncultured Nocardioidaceae bacterium TaxID=253824 RepID=A0A6J4LC38_9ACTN|nr:MAG: Putrescine transport ATP-binding protein PotG [uncultured Nocardioidaceae bacterium]